MRVNAWVCEKELILVQTSKLRCIIIRQKASVFPFDLKKVSDSKFLKSPNGSEYQVDALQGTAHRSQGMMLNLDLGVSRGESPLGLPPPPWASQPTFFTLETTIATQISWLFYQGGCESQRAERQQIIFIPNLQGCRQGLFLLFSSTQPSWGQVYHLDYTEGRPRLHPLQILCPGSPS